MGQAECDASGLFVLQRSKPRAEKCAVFLLRTRTVDWEPKHGGRTGDGKAEILQKHRAREAGPGQKVPGGCACRSGDGHDRLQLHLRSGAQVRRAGEHNPQLDGRGGRKAGRSICSSAGRGGAGDRGAGGCGRKGPGELPAAAGGREPEGGRGAGKAAPAAGRGRQSAAVRHRGCN